MPRSGQSAFGSEFDAVPFYPPDLLVQAQEALAHLADIDLRYSRAEHRAMSWQRVDVVTPTVLIERLHRRHARERQEVEHTLTNVHSRVSGLIMRDLRSIG